MTGNTRDIPIPISEFLHFRDLVPKSTHEIEAKCITAHNMEASSENTTCSEDFSKLKVDELKNYLRERGIQLSDGGKGKRKVELLDLCQKAAAMKQRKLDDSAEDRTKLLEDKLQTSEGKLPHPKSLSAWTHNFSKIPEFTFGDLYNYLVSKEDYSPANFRSFKSLLGFRLFHDGHVVDLKYCQAEGKSSCFSSLKLDPQKGLKLKTVKPRIMDLSF